MTQIKRASITQARLFLCGINLTDVKYYIPPVTPVMAGAPFSDGSSKRLIHCLPKMWWFRASSTSS